VVHVGSTGLLRYHFRVEESTVTHHYGCSIGFEEEARAVLATWARLAVTETTKGVFMPVTTFTLHGRQSVVTKALAELNAAHDEWWMGLNS
jgi:hypothetical protein